MYKPISIIIGLAAVFWTGCATITAPLAVQYAWTRPAHHFGEFSYLKTKPPPVLAEEAMEETEHYRVFSFFMPSVGDNAQENNLVTGRYYRHKENGKKRLVIMLPIYGSSTFPPDIMTAHLTEWSHWEKTNVLRLFGPKDLFHWDRFGRVSSEKEFEEEINKLVSRVQNTVMDIRRLLDWAEDQKEIDAYRIGMAGFSISAIVAAIVMGVDQRVSAGVFVMGSGEPHEVIASGDAYFIKKARKHILRSLGWNQKVFGEKLKTMLATINPVRYALGINPQRVLIFDALYDQYLPRRAQDSLWRAMGYPQRITFRHSHKISFLSMTVLGLNYLDRRAVKFLQQKL